MISNHHDEPAPTPAPAPFLFSSGPVRATFDALALLAGEDKTPMAGRMGCIALINRHCAGDWGDLDTYDKQANCDALETGARILSAYHFPGPQGEKVKLYVITEADPKGTSTDRRGTTIMRADEY